jgi:hypothetical protein
MMELIVCVCDGRNQECLKCSGTGYVKPETTRPIVESKLKIENKNYKVSTVKIRLLFQLAILTTNRIAYYENKITSVDETQSDCLNKLLCIKDEIHTEVNELKNRLGIKESVLKNKHSKVTATVKKAKTKKSQSQPVSKSKTKSPQSIIKKANTNTVLPLNKRKSDEPGTKLYKKDQSDFAYVLSKALSGNKWK